MFVRRRTVYERATWAFINNPLDRAGLDSLHKDTMKMNADGSVDLYFGPSAPAGLETNWIPTAAIRAPESSMIALFVVG